MKRRILHLFTLTSLLVVFVATILAGVVAPFFTPQIASAAPSTTYLLTWPDDAATKGALIAANNDNGHLGSNDANGILSKTHLYTSGGRLQITGPMTLDKEKSQKQNMPIYSTKYYCTPTDNYSLSPSKPGADANGNEVPYIQFTMGVALLKSKDWGGIAKDETLATNVGVIGNGNVGVIHFPDRVVTTTGNEKGHDWDIPGQGGDHDIRTGVNISEFNDQTDITHARTFTPKDWSLKDWDPSLPDAAHIQEAFNKCLPDPRGDIGKETLNYNLANDDKKAEWDAALDALGLGATAADADAAANGSDSGGDVPSLDCKAGANPLNWLVCGVVSGLVQVVGDVDNLITSQLAVGSEGASDDPNQIFCDADSKGAAADSCQAYHAAWSSFRDIALGILVVIGLVILIAQAIGTELLDAYTIRKVLPRLLIAALGITLSWQLMQFFVTLTNDLGLGIRHIIYYPFRSFTNEVNLSGANNFAVSLATAGAITVMGIFGLLSFVGTAALAVLIGFLIIVLRNLVVILLIIIAPIAILMYILPNTQKTYKFWWEAFSKALLMFPLISGLIAVGRVFAAVSSQAANNSSGGDPVNSLIAFAAYFAPYFALPLTFKFAGGALRQIGGFVNDRGRGGFDRLRKFRGNRSKARMEGYAHNFKTGDFNNPIPGRFKRTNAAVGALVNATNTVGTHTSSGLLRGGLGFGARGQTAREALLMQGVESAVKEPAMAANADINAFNRLMVLTGKNHGNQVAAEKELTDYYAAEKNEYGADAFTPDQVAEKVADAKARVANVGGYNPGRAAAAYLAMGRDGTAIRDVEDMGNIAAWVSEGSETVAYRLISQVSTESKRGGRSDLSPSQDHRGKLASAAVRHHNHEMVPDYDDIIRQATMSGAGGETGMQVLSSAPSRVVRGNVQQAMNIIKEYNADPNSVKFGDAAQAAAVVQDLKSNAEMGYGKTDNKIAFQTAMAADGREESLRHFLAMEAPASAAPAGRTLKIKGVDTSDGSVPTVQESNAAYVARLVGDKYSSVPPEQLAMMSEQQRRQMEEQKRAQEGK